MGQSNGAKPCQSAKVELQQAMWSVDGTYKKTAKYKEIMSSCRNLCTITKFTL
jgi:hypothetical protein